MLVWEGFRRKSGWGLCSFDACMRRIQTQEWVRFVQVWCLYEKNSEAGVGEYCAGLMQAWEGFRRRSGWGVRRFDASMRRIQMQDWVRFVEVWCSYEKDLDAGVSEVCAGLKHAWEGFRRKSGWGLCRSDACMRKIQTQGGWGLCRFDACVRRIQKQEWVRFVQVWCKHEKDSDAEVDELCAALMHLWEGFRRRSGWGLCRFDAHMRRIQTQEWLRILQFWCLYEKDSDARLCEFCAGLMLVWEGFRRRSGWGLCSFDASMRRIQTQEWVRFVQVWCTHEKDSDARVVENFAVLMLVWEGFRRTFVWVLCRFGACLRRIQTQEWERFVQVWCVYEKDSDAGVGEVCAGLMLVWEGFRHRSGWGLCRFDAWMRRTQKQEWERFVQVWCVYEKDSDAGVGEVCAGLMQAWEGFRYKSGWDLCRFDAHMRRI